MASHPRRFYGGWDLHFVTFSCYQRRPLLSVPSRCDLFLEILERVRRRYRLVVLAYVVMPEREPQRDSLSTAIQALKLGFVRRLSGAVVRTSRKIGESPRPAQGERWDIPYPDRSRDHFWQARFYDFNVWTEKKRVEKLRYIHRNPVTRGLVAAPEQWLWSSFRWYLNREKGLVQIENTDILVMTVRPRSA
jgi:putative transposase